MRPGLLLTALLWVGLVNQGFAADPEKSPGGDTVGTPAPAGEKVNVNALKQRYWEKKETSDMRVVQNRLYAKALRFEFGAFGGTFATDPFLSVTQLGAHLGFHFSEVFSLHFMGWRNYSKTSSAYKALVDQGARTVLNMPQRFYGAELMVSPIYGKLSVFGRAIFHYDMHVMAGGGQLGTENGPALAPMFGIGQQFFLGSFTALRLDYRFMFFRDNVTDPNTFRPVARNSTAEVITLGVSVLFAPW